MKRKFKSNKLQKEYSAFMREYFLMRHMELLPENEISRPVAEVFYLPHNAVLKDSSITTSSI